MNKTKKSPKIPDIVLKNPKKFAEEADTKLLVKILRLLSSAYYNTGESIVSDDTYDIIKDILERRDPENVYLSEIGAPVDNRNKTILPYTMGSLTKIKPEKDNLDTWLKKYPGKYVISEKLDGASGQYYKESDNVFRLYSRGDGIEGRDISHLIKFIIPSSVKNDEIPVGTSIRGEIIISKNDFKKISKQMKNARNAVSGVVNSKTIDKNIAKLCQFVAYSILHPEYPHDEQMNLLEKYKFKVADYRVVDELNFKMLNDYLMLRRDNSEFEIDGIVVFDSGKAYPHRPGNPEHGFAFKTALDDQIVEAVIKTVHWNPNMDGYLKPVVEILPVEIGGVTIKRATAFNAKFVVDNKLGPGAIIKLIRSGDVIPYIMGVIVPADEPMMPDVEYYWNDTNVDIILKDIYGANTDAVRVRLITHFFTTMGVGYIGEGNVKKIVNSGYKTIPDVINAFKNDKEKLSEIEGIGMKLINKIWTELEDTLKKTDLTTLMAASHVFGRGFGVRKIREIINVYPNIMNEDWNKKMITDKVKNIKGFSTTTAEQFAKYLKKFKIFYDSINKIIDISHVIQPIDQNNDQVIVDQMIDQDLVGMSFVFTGFRDKNLEQKIIKRGGRVSSAVSTKTSVLVYADDSDDNSKKIKDAKKLKIVTMNKTNFIEKFKLT